MIIKEVLGNRQNIPPHHRITDILYLEWFETTKRILRKETAAGREIAVKLTQEGKRLQDGDILWRDDQIEIVVEIIPTEAIVVTPATLLQMGTICYEIGNKHLPLFIQDDEVLVPYEAPLFRLLEAGGYQPRREIRQLKNLLKVNVEPHAHGAPATTSETLFTKILNLTTKS